MDPSQWHPLTAVRSKSKLLDGQAIAYKTGRFMRRKWNFKQSSQKQRLARNNMKMILDEEKNKIFGAKTIMESVNCGTKNLLRWYISNQEDALWSGIFVRFRTETSGIFVRFVTETIWCWWLHCVQLKCKSLQLKSPPDWSGLTRVFAHTGQSPELTGPGPGQSPGWAKTWISTYSHTTDTNWQPFMICSKCQLHHMGFRQQWCYSDSRT